MSIRYTLDGKVRSLVSTTAGHRAGPVGNMRAITYRGRPTPSTSLPLLAFYLINAAATATGATTASIQVTTTGSPGTLYWIVSTSSSPPNAAQILLGKDSTGVTAEASGSLAVATTGTKTVPVTGLTTAASYTAFFMLSSENGTSNIPSAAFVVLLQAGALGVWYSDQYQSSPVPYVPNAVSVDPVSKNVLSFPRRNFAGPWTSLLNAVITDNAAVGPDSLTQAATVVGTGNWLIGRGTSIPAGTYTLQGYFKRNTGSDQSFKMGGVIGPASGTLTATSVWQKLSFTFTAGLHDSVVLKSFDGATGANLQVCDVKLIPGGSVEADITLSGHMYMGTTAYDSVPSFASNVLDFTAAQAVIQFADFTTFNTVTAVTVVNTNAGSGLVTAFLAEINFATRFGFVVDSVNDPDSIFGGVSTQFNNTVTGLWNLRGTAWHVITHRYDGTKLSVWLEDVKLFELATAVTPPSLADFFVGFILSFIAAIKINSIALYPSALSDAQVRQAVQVLQVRAMANGLSVPSVSRVLMAEGDSITIGVISESGKGYVYLYGDNASPAVIGNNIAVSGSRLLDWQSQLSSITSAVPSNRAGRKFIFTVLNTNDMATAYLDYAGNSRAVYLAALATFLDTIRAAGWIVGLATAPPRDNASWAAYNIQRNIVNPIWRTWVGLHCDFLIDFAADPTIGPDAAGANVTYFPDGIHPGDVAYAIMHANWYKPAVDAI